MNARTHDLNGPSSLKRRRLCPGSLSLEALYPEEEASSSYATEGTAKHKTLENLMLGETSEDDVWDFDVLFCWHFLRDQILPSREQVLAYYPECRLELASLGISHGTADLVVDCVDRIILVDWKMGTMFVDHPRWNDQFKPLAVGCWERFGRKPIDAWILQPNHPDDRYRTATDEYLPESHEAAFRAHVAGILAAAQAPDAPFVSGEHCAFCRAKESCPLRAQALARIPRHLSVLAFLESASPVERGAYLDNLKLAKSWTEKAIEACELAGVGGLEFAGYQRGTKRASRVWRDETEARENLLLLCEATDTPPDRVLTSELPSVAVAEKIFRGRIREEWVERVPGGATIVPVKG